MKTIHKGIITSKVSIDQEVNINRILPLIGLLYLESIVHDQRREIYSMVDMTSEKRIYHQGVSSIKFHIRVFLHVGS